VVWPSMTRKRVLFLQFARLTGGRIGNRDTRRHA
jgi:hypothetical protein